MDEQLDAAFDYLMNHHPSYRLLTEAVGLLERRASRRRHTPEVELKSWWWWMDVYPLWVKRTADAIKAAQDDWGRVVGDAEDCPLYEVTTTDIMRLALAQRDRFDTKED